MAEKGIDMKDEGEVRAFAKESLDSFKAGMTALVRQHSDDCTVFYNAGHVGPCTRESADAYTHFELESLPSDGWGYLHFPVAARYARVLGKDCMGMTGKFHTGWGDFHSLKNLAALEYECFRMLSFGFASSIGDQLEPYGVLNPATYKLIGDVYHQIEKLEPWARPSAPVVEAAVLTYETDMRESQIPDSVLGATQMLEELAISFDIIDEAVELSNYKLVIVPDGYVMGAKMQKRLDAYVKAGGAVIACANGGLSEKGQYPACYGASYHGMAEKYPDFIIAEGPLANGLEPGNEYVIYEQGAVIEPDGGEAVLNARAPYFSRTGDGFCSHKYTPSAKGDPYPAAICAGNAILFGHPLFAQYRKNAPLWCKVLISNAIDMLMSKRLTRHSGPSGLRLSLLDQPDRSRYALHVLNYVPVRKSATIDIVEERALARDVTVELGTDKPIKSARIVPDGQVLEVVNNHITLPFVEGYVVVELRY